MKTAGLKVHCPQEQAEPVLLEADSGARPP